MERLPLVVVKRDGRRQTFDKDKLVRGLLRSCDKLSVSTDDLVSIAGDIEQELQNRMEREISAVEVGELAMDRLREIDEVAYVRFASVYRKFKDISTFMDEVSKLLTEKYDTK